MNLEAYQNACTKIVNAERERTQIGTLGEKTVHAVLKNYLEPNEALHEVKIEHYYADIATDSQIIEIQTRNFNALRKKLEVFLEKKEVTIVYPIPNIKWIRWIDEDTGEITSRRKSPKTGSIYKIAPELYKIKSFLNHPNLKFCLLFLNMEEYRLLNGWSRDKKKGSTKFDCIPQELIKEVYIKEKRDYYQFIPQSLDMLEEGFTSKDYKNAAKISLSLAQVSLNILYSIGVVERVGKKGRSYCYKKKIDF